MKKSIGLLTLTMKRLLFFLFAICICKSSNAQENNVNDSQNLKPRIYKVNILTYSNKEFIKGYLVSLPDSGLEISSSPVYLGLEKKNSSLSVYNYNQLRKVIIQRKGAVGRGAGYGALVGLGVGVITGLIGTTGESSSDYFFFSRGQEVGFTGIFGLGAGALIGALVGATAHKTFTIGGNKNKYKAMRESIFDELFRHQSSRNNSQKSPVRNL